MCTCVCLRYSDNWNGDEYVGSGFNELTVIVGLAVIVRRTRHPFVSTMLEGFLLAAVDVHRTIVRSEIDPMSPPSPDNLWHNFFLQVPVAGLAIAFLGRGVIWDVSPY